MRPCETCHRPTVDSMSRCDHSQELADLRRQLESDAKDIANLQGDNADLESRLAAAVQYAKDRQATLMQERILRGAAERERDEAQGRLEKIALQHYEHKALCAYCKERWPCLTYRQATDEGGSGDG